MFEGSTDFKLWFDFDFTNRLEHVAEDKKKMVDVTPTIGKLEDLQGRWKDDYAANKALRDVFRVRVPSN